MNDTWRFIIVVTLLFAFSALLPFAVDARIDRNHPDSSAGVARG